jgi:hypothetical protein
MSRRPRCGFTHAPNHPSLSGVMRGLDPRIHLLAKRMDCRVKPGNDDRFNMTESRYNLI